MYSFKGGRLSSVKKMLTNILLVIFIILCVAFMLTQSEKSEAEEVVALETATTTQATIVEEPVRHIEKEDFALSLRDLPKERVIELKSQELAKISAPFTVNSEKYGVQLRIEKITEIPGGVEVLVKAWKNDKPLGFGAFGTVETERIRIINPPILTYENGRLTENLKGALSESLAHTVSIIGRGGDHIVPGKIGNTTTTVYPQGGSGGATTDGRMYEDRYTSWNTTINASSCRVTSTGDTNQDLSNILGNGNGASHYSNNRLHFGFDTSAMPDTDGIALATFTVQGTSSEFTVGSEKRIYLVSSNPASNGTLATTDYNDVGTTSLGVTDGTWTNTGYNSIPLNTAGLAHINKTGVTNFALRGWYDFNATAPDNSNELYVHITLADEIGTANDPKLVIEHATCN